MIAPRLLVAAAAALLLWAVGCGEAEDGAGPSPEPTAVPTLAPGVTPGPGVTDAQIRLGMTNDIAGSGGTPYGAISTAIDAYFEKVNLEDGGVCGRRLVLIVEDDEYTPEKARELTNRLVEERDVLAIIGALSTVSHKQVAPYLNDTNLDGDTSDGVPDLFVSTGWSVWGDHRKFPWTISFIPDFQTDGRVIGRFIAREYPDARVGILFPNDDFGQDYLIGVRAGLGVEKLAAEEVYDPAEPPPIVNTRVAALKEAGVEVVVLASTPPFTAQALRAAQAEEYGPQFVLSYVNAPSTLAADLGGGSEPERLIAGFGMLDGAASTAYLLSTVQHDSHSAVQEHRRIMESYGGPPVSTLTVYGQALAETVVETLNRACDKLTREGVLRAAESLSGFRPSLLRPGISIDLGPDDHRAIESLQPVRIEADGRLVDAGLPISAR